MSSGRALVAAIAGFSAIGFALLGVIYAIFIAVPPPELNPTSWDWTLRVLVIAAIIGFSVYLLASPESVGQAASRRSNRYTINALIASVVAIVVAVLILVVAGKVLAVSADWTAAKTYTLSDQSIKIVSSLKSDVKAIAFYTANSAASPGGSRQDLIDLLNRYKAHSSHLIVDVVDANREPQTALKYLSGSTGGIQFPTVVFDDGKKKQTTTDMTESGLTTALVKLQQTAPPTIGFLTGHGERDSNNAQQNGYSQVRQQLEKESYKVTTVNLITGTLSVSDTAVVIIAEPQRALTSKEAKAIQGYLDEGGKAMILLDPFMPDDAYNALKPIIQKYGVTPLRGAVIDQKSVPELGPAAVLVNTYPSSSLITKDLQSKQLNTLFYISGGLRPPTSTVGGFQTTSIIQSSVGEQQAWLETEVKPGVTGQPALRYDAGVDMPGPVSMGVTVAPESTTSTVKTKLVVYGDSDFGSNGVIAQVAPSNLDLFANSVSWLAESDELISIRAKDAATPQKIVLDSSQQRAVFFSSVLGVPILVLLAGVFIWWRRR